jgi:prepilin-type N-terminal cleavage/methylation domain-containing protein
MNSVLRKVNDERGLSLVELLVVIIIIGIVAAIAIMQRGGADDQFRRQNIARELKVAFERARFDSVKRRALPPATVTITPGSYTLRTYNNDVNASPVPIDQVTNLPADIVIANYDGSVLTSTTVTFNMRGETGPSPPQLYVCNVNCSSPSSDDANIVLVTSTGTVNLLSGNSSLPSFGVPTITNVGTSTGINPDAVLP